jgi:hypothetical protein
MSMMDEVTPRFSADCMLKSEAGVIRKRQELLCEKQICKRINLVDFPFLHQSRA